MHLLAAQRCSSGTKSGKAKTSLLLNSQLHAMQAYRGVNVYLHAFVTFALDGDEWKSYLVHK